MAGLLYTWGRNDYGRCGLGDTQHREAPTQVPGLSHVVKVRGGAGHTLVITAEGKAVVFGKNYLGQLGVGDDEDIYTPQTLHLEEKVVSCSGGGNFSALATESGAVLTMGCGYFHATGQPSEAQLHAPTPVRSFPAGIKISDVACGELHAISLSVEGDCFAWGRNNVGQCGQGETSRYCISPVRVKKTEGTRVVAISSCFNWNMLVAAVGSEHQVWAWGENPSGVLALASDQPFSMLPTQIAEINSPQIKVISCGNNHGAAVDGNGDVWTWGVGELGQLGLGEECGTRPRKPQKIPFFQNNDLRVVDVAAAKKHTLFLTCNGQVFVSGDDQFGNKEIDKPVNPCLEPRPLNLDVRIAAIGVGGYHSCIVTALE
jgi:alpha-tubulin suppressor-like RCC1 family protein